MFWRRCICLTCAWCHFERPVWNRPFTASLSIVFWWRVASLLCNPCYWDCIWSIRHKYKCFDSLSLCLPLAFLGVNRSILHAAPRLSLGCNPVFQGIHQVYKPAYIRVAPDGTSLCPFVPVKPYDNFCLSLFFIILLYFKRIQKRRLYGEKQRFLAWYLHEKWLENFC